MNRTPDHRLETAIFVDATVVRMILVPATMKLTGRANRSLPALDNWLAYDLRRNLTGPWSRHRGPVATCPHH